MPSSPDAPVLVLSRNLPTKPNANTIKTTNCIAPITSSSTPTYANDNHDAFLYHRWDNANKNKNTSTIRPGTKKPTLATNSNTVAHTLTKTPAKDNPSITPTLKILCTVDTQSSDPTNTDTDAILSITIWNQPIVKCRMPIRSTTHNQS